MGTVPFVWKVRSRLASMVFDVFLWLSGFTESEYLGMIYEEAVREYKSEKANAWLMK